MLDLKVVTIKCIALIGKRRNQLHNNIMTESRVRLFCRPSSVNVEVNRISSHVCQNSQLECTLCGFVLLVLLEMTPSLTLYNSFIKNWYFFSWLIELKALILDMVNEWLEIPKWIANWCNLFGRCHKMDKCANEFKQLTSHKVAETVQNLYSDCTLCFFYGSEQYGSPRVWVHQWKQKYATSPPFCTLYWLFFLLSFFDSA